ncbi:Helix-turn-helix domain-containing protein [Saccharopolyspora shandongensis]|uniref:Helix-turn-helix domain-containing protein n=1 Tax=Saccharopolyspora shandongensis TaxID=418495 RepID=A0A1H3RK69_9PSEU|nr:helix-turn-helix transcriptional regulator [Saccharopolyspora shandongensis]SDZ25755.1 Helix-turn-helix domain-containing protein [Saccharopolyspora shandongensis]
MAQWTDPAAQRWLIGVELRHYRQLANRTAVGAAEAIGCTAGKINHLESGRNRQQPDEVAALLKYYGAPDDVVQRLSQLAERDDQRAWWSPWSDVAATWFQAFVGLEGQAAWEFLYEPVFVPGLLQTEAYARAVTSATPRVRSDHVDRFVAFRQARAAVLTDAEPLELVVVVGEAALRLDVGDPGVLQDQYRHLIRLAALPNVELQVLCPEDGIHSGFTGAFAILGFEHAHSVGYVELQDDAVYIRDQERMRGYSMAAENLREVALSPAESVRFIESLVHD